MAPKIRITRESILAAAVALVRECGAEALNARSVAARLSCSTQPIFSNFSSMADLRMAVVEEAEALCASYIRQETDTSEYPPYKASGMAYVRFAREERELFRLLYMRDRSHEAVSDETGLGNQMENLVQRNTGLAGDDVKLFHLEMWAYVHGIASMFVTGYLELDWELVSRMLTDAYQGLKKQYETE